MDSGTEESRGRKAPLQAKGRLRTIASGSFEDDSSARDEWQPPIAMFCGKREKEMAAFVQKPRKWLLVETSRITPHFT
jgi:hypothetical protein